MGIISSIMPMSLENLFRIRPKTKKINIKKQTEIKDKRM